jgi:demethylmenaquinone methyltransferase/2-methoxy-6-polyprenyl-1,4-benzoquinol methylase
MKQGLQKKLSSSNRQKQIKVDRIFTRISKGYDLMNDIMSFGLHRIWKKEFIDLVEINQNNILIDLATGSGDLLKLIKRKCDCTCIGYDANIRMMIEAKDKISDENIFYVNGRAEQIPFRQNTFDIATLSFGLRNFTNIERSLSEIKRILKIGGKFYCLEFSEINNKGIRKIFDFYCKLIPIYGKLILNNEEAYSYLIQSIREFPNQIQLTKKLLKAGFKNIEVIDILDGVASIHISEL